MKNIDLQIEAGEFLAIMGPSGSGKSTLLHILGCMDVPTSGEYVLNGKRIDQLKEKELSKIRNRTISFVFQHFALLKEYSVYDNIELALNCRKMSDREKKKDASESIGKKKFMSAIYDIGAIIEYLEDMAAQGFMFVKQKRNLVLFSALRAKESEVFG